MRNNPTLALKAGANVGRPSTVKNGLNRSTESPGGYGSAVMISGNRS